MADIPCRVTWRAVRSMAMHSRPGDAFHLTLNGEVAEWTTQDHLIANLIDLVALLVWFKTQDGQKNRNRPKPVQRPGVNQVAAGTSLGGSGVPVEEFADRWAEAVERQLAAEAAAKAQEITANEGAE